MRENYKILGIKESATDEEVRSAYQELKAKYTVEKLSLVSMLQLSAK